MNIKGGSLATAAGAGAVIYIIINIINLGVTFAARSPDVGLDLDTANTLASVISVITCLCALVIDLGVGALYSFLHSRQAQVTPGNGALGGGAAGLIARVVSGLVGACLSLLAMPMLLGGTFGSVPPEFGGAALVAGAFGGVIGGVVGVCIAAVVGLVLGAAGGAVGAMLFGRKQSAA